MVDAGRHLRWRNVEGTLFWHLTHLCGVHFRDCELLGQ